LETSGAVIIGAAARTGAVVAVWPAPSVVLAGTVYGPSGTEYTGTMSILIDINSGKLVKLISSKLGLPL
jgi:hypothetical protein